MERKFLSAMRALLLKDNTLFFSIKMYSKKRNNGIFMHYGSQRAGQRLGTYFSTREGNEDGAKICIDVVVFKNRLFHFNSKKGSCLKKKKLIFYYLRH